MSFIVRAARHEDVQPLLELARQFTLLNLPADRRRIEAKIERSVSSFAGELSKSEAEYLFVVEDTEAEMITGSSLILAKNGTANSPNFSFKASISGLCARMRPIDWKLRSVSGKSAMRTAMVSKMIARPQLPTHSCT